VINTIQNYSFINFRGENAKPIKEACKALRSKIGQEEAPRVPVNNIHLDGAGDVFLSCTKPKTVLDKKRIPNVIKISVHGPNEDSKGGAFAFFEAKGSIRRIKKALKDPSTPEKIEKIVEKLTEGLKKASSSEPKDIQI
jgi:hypothetical protein